MLHGCGYEQADLLKSEIKIWFIVLGKKRLLLSFVISWHVCGPKKDVPGSERRSERHTLTQAPVRPSLVVTKLWRLVSSSKCRWCFMTPLVSWELERSYKGRLVHVFLCESGLL